MPPIAQPPNPVARTKGLAELAAAYLDERFVAPADLVDDFNPEKLLALGAGTAHIGGDPASTGPFYAFVTRPNLNITEGGPAWSKLGLGTPTGPAALVKQLTGGVGLIPLLTNLCESYDAQDLSLDVHGIAEGWNGAKQTTPKNTLASRQDGHVQLAYQEWSGAPVTLLHKIWVDYIDAVTMGYLAPTEATMAGRVLDFAVSIYTFQLLPDAATIEFGARYTGAFPTAAPFSQWAGRLGNAEGIKVTIPYAYSFYEPMDAAIFAEFATSAGDSGPVVSRTYPWPGKLPPTRQAWYLTFPDAPVKPAGV